MIVNFTTKYGRLTLLGESATRLLALGGHSGAVPGAVLAADLPVFLQRLRSGLAMHGDEPSPPPPEHAPREEEDRDEEVERPAPVTLRMRAAPLLEMIETAIARDSDLTWERA